MNRTHRAIAGLTFAAILFVVLTLWTAQDPSSPNLGAQTFTGTVRSAIKNPLEFTITRLKGGVGIELQADLATGRPLIVAIMAGSPAEKAELNPGDIILEVNGVSTTGRTLAQNIENIRGFTGARVTLLIQRQEIANFEAVVQRRSWKALNELGSK